MFKIKAICCFKTNKMWNKIHHHATFPIRGSILFKIASHLGWVIVDSSKHKAISQTLLSSTALALYLTKKEKKKSIGKATKYPAV